MVHAQKEAGEQRPSAWVLKRRVIGTVFATLLTGGALLVPTTKAIIRASEIAQPGVVLACAIGKERYAQRLELWTAELLVEPRLKGCRIIACNDQYTASQLERQVDYLDISLNGGCIAVHSRTEIAEIGKKHEHAAIELKSALAERNWWIFGTLTALATGFITAFRFSRQAKNEGLEVIDMGL